MWTLRLAGMAVFASCMVADLLLQLCRVDHLLHVHSLVLPYRIQ